METYISHKVKIEQGQLCNFAVIICGWVWNVNVCMYTRFFFTLVNDDAPGGPISDESPGTYNYQYYQNLQLSILSDHFPARPHQLLLLHPLWSILINCFKITSLVSPTVLSDRFFLVRFWSRLTSQHWISFLNNNHGFVITKFWADLIQETTACLRIITLSQKVAASWYFATTIWFANWSQYTSWPSWDNAGVSEALSKHILVLGMMNNNHQQKSESSPPWRHETACARSWKYFNVFKQIYIW